MAVARTLFGDAPTRMDYDNIPTVLFSNPNLGTVGLTEAQARERCEDVEIFINTFTPLRHTLSGNPEKTLMKLIVDKARSEEHTSELQSLMRISYAVFCLTKKQKKQTRTHKI